MMSSAQRAMDQPMDVNSVSKLWNKLFRNALLCAQLSKFMNIAKLVVVQIMGSVEDEKTFSTLTFMKTKLQNQLCEHLNLVVCMFAQPFYMIHTFPYDDVIMAQIDEKEKGSFSLMFFGKQPQFSMMTISCALGNLSFLLVPFGFPFMIKLTRGLQVRIWWCPLGQGFNSLT